MTRLLRGMALAGVASVCGLGAETAIARAAPITEFTQGLGTDPTSLTAGPDGNLWFVDRQPSGPAIGRISPAGQVTEFSDGLSGTGQIDALEAGPSGDLWFTDIGATHAIGRITPTGQITEFAAGTSGLAATATPLDMTEGPGGTLFFIDNGMPRQIGEINAQGQISEVQWSLDPNDQANAITDGADGNIYFTIQGNTAGVGELNLATHTVTRTNTGTTPTSLPNDLTGGPDGNVWFDDDGATTISRLTPSDGALRAFGTADGLQMGAQPDAMTGGPDGSVWFIDQLATHDAVGRITPAGVINEFGLPGTPWGITAGIDGSLWLSVGDVQDIVRVSTTGTVTAFHDGIGAGANLTDGSDITVGPDGNLWTIDQGTPKAIVRADVQLPPVATTAAAPTAQDTTTATTGGTVNTRGSAATVSIQYGATPALGSFAPARALPAADGAVPVSAQLTGLTPHTTYFYRVVATNTYGTASGETVSFTTAAVATGPPPPPKKLTTRTVKIGDQRVTVTAGVARHACVADGGSLAVSISATHGSGMHLHFRSAGLFLDRGVAHKRHRTIKGKRRTITVHVANATVHHLPAHRSLSLRKAKSGTHAVRVLLAYTHTARRHGKRRTITTHRAVTLRFAVC